MNIGIKTAIQSKRKEIETNLTAENVEEYFRISSEIGFVYLREEKDEKSVRIFPVKNEYINIKEQ